MKKVLYFKLKNFIYCLFCVLTLFVFFVYNCNNKYNLNSNLNIFGYKTDAITYAKANNNCMLFKTQSLSNNLANILFYVPDTYFVSIISKINDNIYKVQYDNYVGYVAADTIDIVSFVPNKATLENIKFDIRQNAGTQIWSLPSDSNGTILTTISADTKQIEYIASTVGEIPIGGTSNLWYYARFTPASHTTTVFEGYVYSEATTNLSHIPNNLEYEVDEPTDINNSTISNNITAQIIMICFICLPFVILFVLACIKTAKFLKLKKLSSEQLKISEPSQETKTVMPKQFIKKPRHKNDDTIEVVFPEYNYIDDDDLL